MFSSRPRRFVRLSSCLSKVITISFVIVASLSLIVLITGQAASGDPAFNPNAVGHNAALPLRPGDLDSTFDTDGKIIAAGYAYTGANADFTLARYVGDVVGCATPPAGMVSWWAGDDNALDIQSNNNGTLLNGATFAAGKVEQAFSFNGSNGVSVPSTPALNPTEAITLSSWVNPTSYPNDYPTIIRKNTTGFSSLQYTMSLGNTDQAHAAIDNTVSLTGGSVPLNQWSHVAFTYDRQTAVLYVNGIPVASGNFTVAIPTSNTDLHIGTTDFPGRNFNGLIDEASIYSRALGQSEIHAIYNAGSAGMCKPEATPTPSPTPAQMFVVTNTNDSGDGSFRQAILNANATTGAQTITFNILGSGVQTIAPLSPLPDITEQVTIDGYTQPGARPNTLATGNNAVLLIELDGTNASAGGHALRLYYPAANCTVRGLVINRANSVVALDLFESAGNVVEGNFIGTDPTGMFASGNANGVRILGSLANNNTIGGITPAARNVISGNRFHGIATGVNNPQNNVIQGNYIGTNASGTAILPNGLFGISAEGTNFLIGGTATGAGNVIAGGQTALNLKTSLGTVQGNFIGTLADGITPAGSDDYGIAVGGTNNNIGGLDSGARNIIAFSNKAGIYIQSGNHHRIFSNSIFGNSRLGIDINGDDVTPNDIGDADSGPNKLQNFPDLTAATSSGSNTIVQGTLNSTANTTFTLQFFSNANCDASGSEGEIFIGSATVTTDGGGNVPFSTTLPMTIAPGHFITATATDSDNNTSEFSACLPGPATAPPADLQVTNLTAPPQAFTDRPFDLSWTDANNEQTRAEGPWVDKVFLSADNQFGNDTPLGAFTFTGSLDPNQGVDRIQSITIPRAVVPQDAQYFLIVVTDANNDVFEGIKEGNNIRVAPISVSRALLPDLIIEAIEAPNTAFFDQTVTVRWTVKNNSSASTNASEWHDKMFLSNDTILSGDDPPLLDVLNTTYLDAGERYVASAEAQIPRGQFGIYYIIVKTDNNEEVFENNEHNNTLNKAINIQIPSLPDLKVTNVIAPEETFVGGQIALTYRVENQGSRDTSPAGLPNSWVDGVYLSQDQILNEQTDRRIGECPHGGNLAQNEGYNFNCTVNTPGDIAGNWYVFVKTDDKNFIYEFVNENNNTNYDRVQPGSPMVIRATPPDLVVPAVNAPATGTAARNITVGWTVRNQGAFDAAPSWFDRIYLSDDAVFSPTTDTPLATVAHGVLAAGQEYNASAEVRLPSCISGTKYFFVMTDSGNQIFEYDAQFNAEQNNESTARAIAISLVPADLQVTSVSNPNIGNAGQPIQVGWTVTNNGTGATIENNWVDQVYLSPTAAFNHNTALSIGAFTRQGNLNQGESYARTENITVPNQAQGNYFVLVKTDTNDSVEECANDENNISASTTQININNNLPDLRISSVNSIGNTVAGSTITVNWTGLNAGNAPAQNQSRGDAVYFSTNNTLDANDQRLVSTVVSGTLAVGASYQAQAQVTIPIVAPGNYFLIVAADDGNFVFEGQYENNNTSAAALPIVVPEVDLQVSNVNAPTTSFSGQLMNVTWTVTNAGTNPTIGTNWTDYVYLSRDQILDPTDRSIGYLSRQVGLPGGQSYDAALDVFVPAGFTGQWYLFVVTDRNNQIAESSENNNTSSERSLNLELAPPADLVVSSVTAPTTSIPGEQEFFQWTIQNNGANPAPGLWTDSVYLSTDAAWSINDVLVGQETRLGLNAGQSYNVILPVILPAMDLGQYYVIVRTDARNRVRETDETNNTGVSSGRTTVDVTQLQLGTPLNTTLKTGQERYYRTNAPANETVRFSIIGQGNSSNELFTRFGAMVSRSQYDFLFNRPNEPDQETVVPNTQAGNYFNLVRGEYVSTNTPTPNIENVSVKAEIIPFSIQSVSLPIAGNNGETTVEIRGAKLSGATSVSLQRSGITISADKFTEISTLQINARFPTRGLSHGAWDVVVMTPQGEVRAQSGLTIESGKSPQLAVDFLIPASARVGRPMAANLSLKNLSNVNMERAMVWIEMPEDIEAHAQDDPIPELDEGRDPTLETFINDNGRRVLALFIYNIAPNQTKNIPLNLTLGQGGHHALSVETLVLDRQSFADTFARSMETAFVNGWIRLSQIQGTKSSESSIGVKLLDSDCADGGPYGDVDTCLYLRYRESAPDRIDDVAGIAKQAPGIISGGAARGKPVIGDVKKVYTLLRDSNRIVNKWKDYDNQGIDGVVATDPNDKIGPSGFGPQTFVGIQDRLPYIINFENVPTATAPAQRIRVTDQLDPNLDWRTFRLKEIGFGSYRITVPENRAFFQQRIQLGAEFNNLLADINAGVDIATGKVTWTLTAIDPATGEQPNGASLGLLPPNNGANDGQGFVTYTIKPKATAATGTLIRNNATIIFDTEEPITTNTVSNTLDADLPTSAVGALPANSQQTFTLTWSGEDPANGSGLQSYDIWVSENDAPFQPFVSGTTETSATFNGQPGRTYRFYSIARDNTGNVEAAPPVPDAVTIVRGVVAVQSLTLNPPMVTGGEPSVATVALNNPAPAGGISITLGSDNPAAAVPASLNVPEGASSVTFNVTTALAAGDTSANITASFGNATQTATLTIKASPALTINDVTVAEPSTGTANATFNVTLSFAAALPVAVNHATADDTATDGNDYVHANNTLTFAPGETTKTVTVVVNSDALNEGNETFFVNLTGASNALIADTQGIATITPLALSGRVLISEFRFRGPTPATGPGLPTDGSLDEFIELYNNSNTPLTIGTTDGSVGWALMAESGSGGGGVRLIHTIPNGTVIPARGHYLIVNSGGYSLRDYGGNNAAAGDAAYTMDIPDGSGITLFNTSDPANFTLANRLDAAGFASAVAPLSPLYREGVGLPSIGTGDAEHSFVRKLIAGLPQDTDDNAADFVLVTPTGNLYGGVPSTLGAPGPENLTSPVQRNGGVKASLIDPVAASTAPPNRIRSGAGANPTNAAFGTLDIRRRFRNSTGAPVTALRFRIVDVTTLNSPGYVSGGGQADLRVLSSPDLVEVVTSRGTLTVRGTALDQATLQPNGGGLNSTLTVALPGGVLAPGSSIDVRFLLGVQQNGSFRFFVNVEALTGPTGPGEVTTGATKAAGSRKQQP